MVVPAKARRKPTDSHASGQRQAHAAKKSPQPTAEEIAKISEWIKAGAQDDSANDDHEKTR